jgi:predicted transcriptional regulator
MCCPFFNYCFDRDSQDFKKWRDKLNKTQKEIAQFLGVSVKAIHNFEQGWRNIPANVGRQMHFLFYHILEL